MHFTSLETFSSLSTNSGKPSKSAHDRGLLFFLYLSPLVQLDSFLCNSLKMSSTPLADQMRNATSLPEILQIIEAVSKLEEQHKKLEAEHEKLKEKLKAAEDNQQRASRGLERA